MLLKSNLLNLVVLYLFECKYVLPTYCIEMRLKKRLEEIIMQLSQAPIVITNFYVSKVYITGKWSCFEIIHLWYEQKVGCKDSCDTFHIDNIQTDNLF